MLKHNQTQKVVLIISARAIDIEREIEVVKAWIAKNYVFLMEVALSWVEIMRKTVQMIAQKSPDLWG